MKLPGGAFVRLLALIGHALWGVVVTAITPSGALSNSRAGRRVVRFWHQGVLAILGIRLKPLGAPLGAPVLIVANHISWIDIAALGALCPGHFVAKSEIEAWPVIGWLARLAGTYYIQRGDRSASAGVAQRMAEAFAHGQSVLLFPEGTSTDGRDVRPFHARLFTPAIEADCPIQPVLLRYPDATGATHPAAPFIGDDTLVHHLWGLLRARGEVTAEVRFFAPELPAGQSARALANRAHDIIATHNSDIPRAVAGMS
ncbi:1-acyl-sn-glycerol-3-phosphate acyltransferase [Acidiferrobacter sp.]|uniref:lysophospholipid acyltransferase family protein n=1 Tax=Acidiferrobacter sp. TaxID=1872107 RepID=UPI0026166043|nr:lysophospholipid acyltransferase family protein [Acidiferrobacter sp.]